MVYSAKSDSAGTVSQFTRRKKITITTAGTSTPALYQVMTTIAYELEMQADFQDVRFNTKAGTYIDYWIESHTASSTAAVWLELPDAIADPGSDYVWMYYGNSRLSDGSNGTNTFDFFDDFSGDLSKWTLTKTPPGSVSIVGGEAKITGNTAWNTNGMTSNYTVIRPAIIEWKTRPSANLSASLEGYGPQPLNHASGLYFHRDYYASLSLRRALDGSFTAAGALGSYTLTTQTVKFILKPTAGYTIFWDGTQKEDNAVWATDGRKIAFSMYSTLSFYVDDVRVRKYIVNEPTPSYGTAQHQRRVPAFL